MLRFSCQNSGTISSCSINLTSADHLPPTPLLDQHPYNQRPTHRHKVSRHRLNQISWGHLRQQAAAQHLLPNPLVLNQTIFNACLRRASERHYLTRPVSKLPRLISRTTKPSAIPVQHSLVVSAKNSVWILPCFSEPIPSLRKSNSSNTSTRQISATTNRVQHHSHPPVPASPTAAHPAIPPAPAAPSARN